LWPRPPMTELSTYQLSDEYCKKMENSLSIAYKIEDKNFDKTKEWNRIAALIKEHFFDLKMHLKKDKIINFRKDNRLYQKLFNDQFYYLNPSDTYTKSYLQSIDLILEYHRLASKIDKTLLASVSESIAGNNICAHYRGKRVSEKLLFHTTVVNDLINIIPFNSDKRSVILDIGCGYGALSRMLHYYTANSCHILLDLPETVVLTSYFIKYNFPTAKIALLDDIIDDLNHFEKLTLKYDFIIITPSVLNFVKSRSVDLVINTASLGFMQKEYLEFYLSEIDCLSITIDSLMPNGWGKKLNRTIYEKNSYKCRYVASKQYRL